jgi:hypothetical protein
MINLFPIACVDWKQKIKRTVHRPKEVIKLPSQERIWRNITTVVEAAEASPLQHVRYILDLCILDMQKWYGYGQYSWLITINRG